MKLANESLIEVHTPRRSRMLRIRREQTVSVRQACNQIRSLSKDRTAIHVNESLTLAGIPPESFGYQLGSKSALDWIIDQYQLKGESDPNRDHNPATSTTDRGGRP